jgi:hypothetical protein
MSDLELHAGDERAVPQDQFVQKLSNPMVFFWPMAIFLILTAFVAAILYRQAHNAYVANPGLNTLILGVLAFGIILTFSHVLRLRPEVRWFNSFRAAGSIEKAGKGPVLLSPMRMLLGSRQNMAISTAELRSILDSIASRLDEARDTSRYLTGLLVFLGLLGTFWGLLGTIGSISTVIQSLSVGGGDTADVLAALKEGLSAPLAGMSTAFSTSLFGLSGSLILGFLDLQAGRAQNRFYNELEEWLSSVTDVSGDFATPVLPHPHVSGQPDEMKALSEQLARMASEGSANQRTTAAMANLAEGIQGLVKNMRTEQQMLRDWIEAHQQESRDLRAALENLASKLGKK